MDLAAIGSQCAYSFYDTMGGPQQHQELSRVGAGGSKRAKMMQAAAQNQKSKAAGGASSNQVSAQRPRPMLQSPPLSTSQKRKLLDGAADPYDYHASDNEDNQRPPATPLTSQQTPFAHQRSLGAATPHTLPKGPSQTQVFSRRPTTTPGVQRQTPPTPAIAGKSPSIQALTLLGKRPSSDDTLDQSPTSQAARWLQQVAPPGMQNHINTCYMNAVLQVLFSLQPFISALQALNATQPPADTPASAARTPATSNPTAPTPLSAAPSSTTHHQQLKTPAGPAARLPLGLSTPGQATAGWAAVGQAMPAASLTRALAGCLEELQASAHNNVSGGARQSFISPLRVKRSMKGGDWKVSTHQQDAHEFLVALMDGMLGEVMAAQRKAGLLRPAGSAATPSAHIAPKHDGADRTPAPAPQHEQQQEQQQQVQQQQEQAQREDAGVKPAGPKGLMARLGDVLCPGVRTFHGCLQHTYICRGCGHESHTKEQFSHLSLKMPEGCDLPSLRDLLDTHFQDEEVEKTCDACKQQHVTHTVRHQLSRLPPVLALQLKRFAYAVEDGLPRYWKLQTCVSLPASSDATLDLGCYCCPDAHPHTFLTQHLATCQPAGPTSPALPRTASTADRVLIDCDADADGSAQEHQGPAAAGPAAAGAAGAQGDVCCIQGHLAAPASLASCLDQPSQQQCAASSQADTPSDLSVPCLMPRTRQELPRSSAKQPRLGGASVGAAMDVALGFGSTGTVSQGQACPFMSPGSGGAVAPTTARRSPYAGGGGGGGALATIPEAPPSASLSFSPMVWRGGLKGGARTPAGPGSGPAASPITAGRGVQAGSAPAGVPLPRLDGGQFFGSSAGGGGGGGGGDWWQTAAHTSPQVEADADAGRGLRQVQGGDLGQVRTGLGQQRSIAVFSRRPKQQQGDANAGLVGQGQGQQGGGAARPQVMTLTLSDDEGEFPGLQAALAASVAQAGAAQGAAEAAGGHQPGTPPHAASNKSTPADAPPGVSGRTRSGRRLQEADDRAGRQGCLQAAAGLPGPRQALFDCDGDEVEVLGVRHGDVQRAGSAGGEQEAVVGGGRQRRLRGRAAASTGGSASLALSDKQLISSPQVVDLFSSHDDADDEEAKQMALAIELSKQDVVMGQQEGNEADDEELQQAIRQSMACHEAEFGTLPEMHAGEAGPAAAGDASAAATPGLPPDDEEGGGGDGEAAGSGSPARSSSCDIGEVTLVEDDEETSRPAQDPSPLLLTSSTVVEAADRPALQPLRMDQLENTRSHRLSMQAQAQVKIKAADKAVLSSRPGHVQEPPQPLLSSLAHYNLRGAVCHRGLTPFSGHYVAHALLPLPAQPATGQEAASAGVVSPASGPANPPAAWQWWRYDDRDVTPVTAARARQEMGKTGYMLFLVAQTPHTTAA